MASQRQSIASIYCGCPMSIAILRNIKELIFCYNYDHWLRFIKNYDKLTIQARNKNYNSTKNKNDLLTKNTNILAFIEFNKRMCNKAIYNKQSLKIIFIGYYKLIFKNFLIKN